ncbi:hypothetical protein B0H13DRAFT_2344337 [Mycena leptocephala]|nr:hypothetical protein B0H13DRAFT_2344337 [Mycena leptocephala]
MAVSTTTSSRVSRLQVSQRIKEPHVQFQRAQFYMTNPVERPFFATNNGYVWEGTVALV